MMPEQQQRILGYFIEEAKDHLATLEQGLLNLQATIEDSEMVNEVFRAAHSVKGGAAMLGISSMQRTAHRLEDYFKVLKESPIKVDRKLESMFLQVFDGLQALLEELQGPFGLTEDKAQEVMTDLEPVFEQLEQHLNALSAGTSKAAGEVAAAAQPSTSKRKAKKSSVASEDSALKLVFKSDVPGHLREMLALFKQPDTDASRAALQSCCEALERIGAQFDLQGWEELAIATRLVAGNPDNTYRTLAPIVIKELKKAQEQVLKGQAEAVTVCSELEIMLPPVETMDSDDAMASLLDDALTETEEPDLADLFESESQPVAVDASDDLAWMGDLAANPDDASSQSEVDLFGSSLDDFVSPSEGSGEGTANAPQEPSVGVSELNSLADLFEGEMANLDSPWEEVADGEAAIADGSNGPDIDIAGDFADLLENGLEEAAAASPEQDLADLFGETSSQDASPDSDNAPLIDASAAEPAEDFTDLFDLSPETATSSSASMSSEQDLDSLLDSVNAEPALDDMASPAMLASEAAASEDETAANFDAVFNDLGDFFEADNGPDVTIDLESASLSSTPESSDAIAAEPTVATPSPDLSDAEVADDLWADTDTPPDAAVVPDSEPGRPDPTFGDIDDPWSMESVEAAADDGTALDALDELWSESHDEEDVDGGEAQPSTAGADEFADFADLGVEEPVSSSDSIDLAADIWSDTPASSSDHADLADLFDEETAASEASPQAFPDRAGANDDNEAESSDLDSLLEEATEDFSDAANEIEIDLNEWSDSAPEAEAAALDFDLEPALPSTEVEDTAALDMTAAFEADDALVSGDADVPLNDFDATFNDLQIDEDVSSSSSDVDFDAAFDDLQIGEDVASSSDVDLDLDEDLLGMDEDASAIPSEGVELGGLDLSGDNDTSLFDDRTTEAANSLELSETPEAALEGTEAVTALDVEEEDFFASVESTASAPVDSEFDDFFSPSEETSASSTVETTDAFEAAFADEPPQTDAAFTDSNTPESDWNALLSDENDSEGNGHSPDVAITDAADIFTEDFAALSAEDDATPLSEDVNFELGTDRSETDETSVGNSDFDAFLEREAQDSGNLLDESSDADDALDDLFEAPLVSDESADVLDLADLSTTTPEATPDFDFLDEMVSAEDSEANHSDDRLTPTDTATSTDDLAGLPDPLFEASEDEIDDLAGLLDSNSDSASTIEASAGLDDLDALLTDETEAVPEAADELNDLDDLLNDDADEDDSSADFNDLDALLDAPLEAAAVADEEETDFDELDALLEDEPDSAGIPEDGSETVDFDDLEALLETDDSEAPASVDSSPDTSEPDEFSDLEKLLEEADKTLGGSSPTIRSSSGGRSSRRVGAMVDQTMRVSVKHLDNLNNLVGELVVNRNSLEQDQERLRQFLDNLLFQVQQLNDVGQRMRDLYERSLLESSLISSSRSVTHSVSTAMDSSENGGNGGSHATGATFDALEMDRFTGFHTLSQEMIELIVRVRESASDIGYTVESADQTTRQFRQVTTQLQEGLNKARMVPFAQTADRLPRAVRDISLKCGKEARLIVEGRDTLIDKMILERLYDPMTHLVNNAITHGIELPEERAAVNKPREGTITVRAFYQGNQTVIYIADDGGGINPNVVKQKAIKKGLITQAEANAMTVLETYELLFRPGFSTRDKADDFAGRGVGMDVVRTALSEIRGSITIDSEMGKGTSFTIRLPLTLSISKALSCLNNQARIAFPMDGVEDMFDVPQERIQVDENSQSSIQWRDSRLVFQPLSELLHFNRSLGRGRVYGGNQDDDTVSIVVLRSANTYIGLQVDRVLGEQEIVIKQLEGPVPKPMGIAGATVLGDGRVMPIADVLELIDIAQGRVRREASSSIWTQTEEPPAAEVPAAKAEPTVLIVDDSITVRELLSMSFNKVGYRVEQARDGQEAWEKLRSGLPCDLVFCDIEMPRMDGLELLSRMQKDGLLKRVPIAMLTSRGADRHRQMALDLGASGYFTKPYLEEALLDAAQRMLNGEVLLTKAGTEE
ncbi:MAG: response regulator [Cyanobacteria bacterium J06638_28]